MRGRRGSAGPSRPRGRGARSRAPTRRRRGRRARARRRVAWSLQSSSARPWPSLSSPLSISSSASSGSSSRRIRFEIATRLRPTRRPTSSLVSPRSSTSIAHARASSTALRSSRAMFSASARSSRSQSSASRTIAGIALELGDPGGAQPALAGHQLVARRRRSGRTTIGWSTPRARIDSASSASACLVEVAARLARVRLDQVDGDLAQALLVLLARGRIAARPRPMPRRSASGHGAATSFASFR